MRVLPNIEGESRANDFEESPYNCEAEQYTLGSVMSNNSLLDKIDFLKEEHFYAPVHKRIFSTILSLRAQGSIASGVSLKRLFEDDIDLKAVGGSSYLAKCIVASSANTFPEDTAREIMRTAQARALIEFCEKAKKEARTSLLPISDIALSLAEKCDGIANETDDSRIESDLIVSDRILKGMADVLTPVSTGLDRLDAAMDGGLYPGKSYAFAAEKKTGKTVLLSTISRNLALKGKGHLFIAGEMSSDEIHQRVLAGLAGATTSQFRADGKKLSFHNKISEAAIQCNGKILYRNAPGLSFEALQRIALKAVRHFRVEGIILDYWQLVRGQRNGQSTAEHLDSVAQWLADFGRKSKIWIIAAAQINQEGNTRGGEGIRLAFDQVYRMRRLEDDSTEFWLEMMDTRYTTWMNLGSKDKAGLTMNAKGPFFESA